MIAPLRTIPPTNRNGASLDAIDLALIDELRRDGRMTHEELSRRVALSRPAVVGRMRRLQELGVIRGFTAITDWEMLGYALLAYVHVRTAGKCRETAEQIAHTRNPDLFVEECHRTTGEWCLLVKVRARSSSAIEAFLDSLTEGGNVHATMTMMALSTL